MMKRRLSQTVVHAALACTLTIAGCSQSPPSSSPSPATTSIAVTPTPEKPDFSAEVVEKAKKLESARDKERFEYELCKDEKNALAFIYLASTAEDEGTLSAALQAMEITPIKEALPPSYHSAVAKNLDSRIGPIQRHAIFASKNSVKGTPNPVVLDKILKLATLNHNLEAREMSFQVLGDYTKRNEDPIFLKVLLQGLSDHPPIAASALRTLNVDATRSEQAGQVKKALEELLRNEDPGVRGRAAAKFGEVYYEQPELVLKTLSPMIGDSHPYVRGQVAMGLSRVSSAESATKIMSLLEDKEPTLYESEFQGLAGRAFRNFGSQTSRVDTTALEALQALTFGRAKEEQFRYEFPKNEDQLDEHVAGQIKKAKDWFARVYAQK